MGGCTPETPYNSLLSEATETNPRVDLADNGVEEQMKAILKTFIDDNNVKIAQPITKVFCSARNGFFKVNYHHYRL
ncbi:unnamed protein product [Didymodactylos carnosus]|uniref:Uncharacterized protein n=1 Tax=Didymodactylos carnosus TaxID=1234261 RepID=A0A813VMP3_9BILA|nr:unnamed protein product [Didymodactylos carnosus]CAF3630251.1 unnamed protein product [Didymodactylos carnosus]